MPNGYEKERDAVHHASRFWGALWQIGDTAYYLGIVGSLLLPMVILVVSVRRFQSWQRLLWDVGWGVLAFVLCFPAGLGLCLVLKAWARHQTGVVRHSGSTTGGDTG